MVTRTATRQTVEEGPQYGQYREDRIEAASHIHEDAASKAARKLPVRLDVNPSRVAQLLSLEALPYGRVGFQELIVTVLSGTSYDVMAAFFNKNIPEFRLDCIFPDADPLWSFYIRRYKHNDGQKTRHHVKVRQTKPSLPPLDQSQHFGFEERFADASGKAEMLGQYRDAIMWEEYECSIQGQPGSIFGDTWTPFDSCMRGRAPAGATPNNERPDNFFVQMFNDDPTWDLVRKGNGAIQWNETGFYVLYEE